ncbi:MAG: class I tRNA ligase family protein, partial [Bacteroidota bacterium]|nr:class I tRNA ligase family protein [Bacteroidota bacterium]
VLTRAIYIFEQMLKLAHPFMPFITEELWQIIDERKPGESISTSEFPKADKNAIDEEAEKEMELIQEVITALRNIRGEMSIPPSKLLNVIIKTNILKEANSAYIKKLAKVDSLVISENIEKPKVSASAVIKGCEIFVPLEGIIDLDVERKRIQKDIDRLEGSLTGIEKKLSNENFLKNAAKEVVEKEKQKKADWLNNLQLLKNNLSNLQ